MTQLTSVWETIRLGGPMVYPLLALGALVMLIILDRAAVYLRALRLPAWLPELLEGDFGWEELEARLAALGPRNAFARFLRPTAADRERPIWSIESRADTEAGRIDQGLSRGLWVLETSVTAAPLIGLLGTITGMMQAFKLIGANTLVAPTEVTAGVAEALIATALGLLVAIVALFTFNFYERLRARAIDRMEQLGTRLVDRIRIDQQRRGRSNEAA